MDSSIDKRKIEKINISVTIDKPTPMPLMLSEEVGKGTKGDKSIEVLRSVNGNLLMVHTITGPEGQEKTNSYIVDVGKIVEGILAYEESTEAQSEKAAS